MIFADDIMMSIYILDCVLMPIFNREKAPGTGETLRNFVASSVSSVRVRTMLTKFPTGPIPSHWYRPHQLTVHTVHSRREALKVPFICKLNWVKNNL